MTIGVYLVTTRTGNKRHLAVGFKDTTLCGRQVERMETNSRTGDPIPFSDHWRRGSTYLGGDICSACEAKVP